MSNNNSSQRCSANGAPQSGLGRMLTASSEPIATHQRRDCPVVSWHSVSDLSCMSSFVRSLPPFGLHRTLRHCQQLHAFHLLEGSALHDRTQDSRLVHYTRTR